MKSKHLFTSLLYISFILASQLSWAQWSAVSPKEFQLPPPPAEGSAAYEKDFQQLHKYEQTRTQAECKLGDSQSIPSFEVLYGRNRDLLSKEEAEALTPFMKNVFQLTERISEAFKVKYKRPRPFVTDPTLEPCAKKPGGAKAYPSAHTAAGFVGACVLSKIYPERKKNIEQYGIFIGELRAKVGVHHPSDVKAGWILGKQICDYLMSQPDFKKELKSQ